MPAMNFIEEVRDRVVAHDRDEIARLAEQVRPADWADALRELAPGQVAVLLQWLPDQVLADALAEMEPSEAARLLRTLTRPEAADLLEAMDPDDATDVVDELPEAEAEQILVAMEPADAAEIRELLAYPADSAGGLMTPEFVAVAPNVRADEAIAALRVVAEEAETVSYVYVVDTDDRLLGVLSLHNLVLSRPETLVAQMMAPDVAKVRVDADQAEAAGLLRDRNLMALPVVDDRDRLLGIITADDAIEVLEAELTEDYLRLAGTDAEEMARRSPAQVARLRLPWLLGTMCLELVAAVVISRFDDVLQKVILLASFMPVISAISGNVGLQAAAIVVRGLDTGHVTLGRWRRQLTKELSTALLMAATCGIILGTIGAVWSQHLPFGIVIGVALMCSMLTAGFMGTMIPMLSKRIGFDPAATAGPFETAFQDVIGFGVFLWLASLLVNWLQ